MFNKFKDIFQFGSKEFLGVDIGTNSIRVVELAKKGRTISLQNYGEVQTSAFQEKPFRIFRENILSLSDQNVAEAISRICSESGMKTKEVNFSIPDFASFFTTINLPRMDKSELQQAIQYEVRPYIPLPLSDITLDWVITEGEPSKTPLKVLVVAIPNDVISQYRKIAGMSGLKLNVLEPEVFALVKASIKEEKITALIDIGARSSTCSILENKVLKTSYSFNIAGNELTEAEAKSLNIDYNEAEAMKRKYGLVKDNQNGEKKTVREILTPMMDSVLEEVKKVFRNYYREEGKKVEKIVLTGGMSLMPGVIEYFEKELKKETELADPFLHIACPPVLTDSLKRMGPPFAIAVGLALKGLE